MPKAKSKKTSAGKTLLEVNDLCMYFDTAGKRVKASEHISFDIKAGETFGREIQHPEEGVFDCVGGIEVEGTTSILAADVIDERQY